MTLRGSRPSSAAATSASAAARTVVLGGVGGDLDPAAHLAVDLHRVGDRLGRPAAPGRPPGRPRRPASPSWPSRRHSSSAMCGANGATISTSGSATARGVPAAADRGGPVGQLDQLGDRGVEPQAVHVGADAVDGPVQQPRRSRRPARRRRPGRRRSARRRPARQTRCRNRCEPTTARVSHGRDTSSGPIDIS